MMRTLNPNSNRKVSETPGRDAAPASRLRRGARPDGGVGA